MSWTAEPQHYICIRYISASVAHDSARLSMLQICCGVRRVSSRRADWSVLAVMLLCMSMARQTYAAVTEVDTVNCVNVLQHIRLIDQIVDFQFDGTIAYNLSSIAMADRAGFTIQQPLFYFTGHFEDPTREPEVLQLTVPFMRAYKLQEASSTPPYSMLAMLMVTPVVFTATTPDVGIKNAVEAVVRKTDLQAIILQNTLPATVTVNACFWYETRQNDTMLTCALSVDHEKCVYLPFRAVWLGIEGTEWALALVSLMSGFGNLLFKMDIQKSMDHGDMDCSTSSELANVRLFPFRNCPNTVFVATCFEKGVPCSLEESESNVRKLWRVYGVMTNGNPDLITNSRVSPRTTPGEFQVMFDQVQMSTSNEDDNVKDRYFKDTVRRPCFPGLVPHNVLVREHGFQFHSACTPCLFNTYYAELPTPRTNVTQHTTKTKTLFLDLVQAYDNTSRHVYRLVENESMLSLPVFSSEPPSDWAVAIGVGTIVTINMAQGLQFSALRSRSALAHTTALGVGNSTILTIVIGNIYGEDNENADDPIFIDVLSNTQKHIVNRAHLAILPIRYPLHQVCKPCLDNYVTTDYAGSAITACVRFDGARRMLNTTNVTALRARRAGTTVVSVPATSVSLLDTIAGFQLRNIAYAADKTKVEMFLDTNALLVGIHSKEIVRGALIFFGMDANPSINFSIDTAYLMDLPTPQTRAAGSTRALLQTGPAAPVATMQTVRVVLRIHRSNGEASLFSIRNIALAGGVLVAVILIVLAVVGLVARSKNDGMTPVSQFESNDEN